MNVVKYLIDTLKSILAGLIASLVIAVIAFIILFINYPGDYKQILTLMITVFLLIGSLGLLLSAMFIIKPEFRGKLAYDAQWKRTFKVMNFTTVLFIIDWTLISVAIFIDKIVRMM